MKNKIVIDTSLLKQIGESFIRYAETFVPESIENESANNLIIMETKTENNATYLTFTTMKKLSHIIRVMLVGYNKDLFKEEYLETIDWKDSNEG